MLRVGGRSLKYPSRLILGADTLSPTEVGALSVAVHPDQRTDDFPPPACGHAFVLLVRFFFCFSVWHLLAFKSTHEKAFPASKGL